MSGQPLGAEAPTRRRSRSPRPDTPTPPGVLAAAAIAWSRTGGPVPAELVHLRGEDQALLWDFAQTCDPDLADQLLAEHHQQP